MKTRLFLFTGQMLDVASFCLFFIIIPATVIAQLDVTERNPIVSQLFIIGGFMLVAAVKLGIVSFVVYRDAKRPIRPRKTQAIMLPVAASGYVGAVFNTVALITVLSAMGTI